MNRDELLELYRNPIHFHVLHGATHIAQKNNPTCGDSFTIYLKVEKGKISAASFTGSGCAISTASCCLLLDELIGKKITDVEKLTFLNMQTLLGIPISAGRVSCATLGLDACKIALQSTEKKEK
jgi:nitrogen fixation protein NifU and related proteins